MSGVRAAFRTQAHACAKLGSPFMERLMTLCADRLEPGGAVGEPIHRWEGDVGPSGASVPLRLAGALHALVRDGTDAGLARVYPPPLPGTKRYGGKSRARRLSRALRRLGRRRLRWPP